MGSFTEFSLSFYFREQTPPEVLAPFAPLHQTASVDSRLAPEPGLPVFQPVPGDNAWWEPDWRAAYGPEQEDPLADEPWRHDWAPWLSTSMSVATASAAALTRSERELWHFSCRCAWKVWPTAVHEALEWLGPFIDTYDNPYGWQTLVGVVTYDSSRRPYLLWARGGRLAIENLNGPDDEI